MPFKSAAQERFLFANKPELANKWRMEHPKQNFKRLPEKLGATTPGPKAPKAPRFSGWEKFAK